MPDFQRLTKLIVKHALVGLILIHENSWRCISKRFPVEGWSLQCSDKMCCCTLRKRPETWCFARLSLGQKTPGPPLRCAGSIQATRPEISTIRRWATPPKSIMPNNCGMIDRNQGTWTEMTKWKLMRVHLNRSVPLRWLRSTSTRLG
jgi:hypothetical protein